ncbi:hypothetical protein CC80DRAFT_260020 [Byssothecium circinans]|uniref:CFEM domain-containing protein n=1 Tax=Byssothecium circinans TaxID=147558 RepID=A0A6A5U9B0_9PLEO|nr:hypothetical protein CC80DRAFT_260020 [Byssothecium circinans]
MPRKAFTLLGAILASVVIKNTNAQSLTFPGLPECAESCTLGKLATIKGQFHCTGSDSSCPCEHGFEKAVGECKGGCDPDDAQEVDNWASKWCGSNTVLSSSPTSSSSTPLRTSPSSLIGTPPRSSIRISVLATSDTTGQETSLTPTALSTSTSRSRPIFTATPIVLVRTSSLRVGDSNETC